MAVKTTGILLARKTSKPSHTSKSLASISDEPISVPVQRLRPTQVAVGMWAVAAKRKRLEVRKAKGEKLDQFLRSRPIPTVRGPRNLLYIVDHHHLTLAVMQSGVATMFAAIIKDLSNVPAERFWSEMIAEGLAYPFDEFGDRIPLSRIPKSMVALKADPYRDLAWSVREAGGFEKCWTKYSEFRWANFFRTSIDPRVVERDYGRAVSIALRLARSSSAAHLPGFLAMQEAA